MRKYGSYETLLNFINFFGSKARLIVVIHWRTFIYFSPSKCSTVKLTKCFYVSIHRLMVIVEISMFPFNAIPLIQLFQSQELLVVLYPKNPSNLYCGSMTRVCEMYLVPEGSPATSKIAFSFVLRPLQRFNE